MDSKENQKLNKGVGGHGNELSGSLDENTKVVSLMEAGQTTSNSASNQFLKMQDVVSKASIKYASILELQDKAISVKDRKHRDCAIKKSQRSRRMPL
ncbi:hypothetical protein V6N12_068062 [Hibiscus sabdariffa]|uniref:Uncharacterized protein n=1 Tax=Hibiscus sabdariffa TaxID=183260 RepID=A0ABR2FP94_9ROSI